MLEDLVKSHLSFPPKVDVNLSMVKCVTVELVITHLFTLFLVLHFCLFTCSQIKVKEELVENHLVLTQYRKARKALLSPVWQMDSIMMASYKGN